MIKKGVNIAVIGGGISGLSTSFLLRKHGFNVDLYEQQNQVGGKIGELKGNGFRFDTGPSLFTLPDLYYNLYNGTLELINSQFKVHKLANICRYFFPNGKKLDAVSNPVDFALEAEKEIGEPANNITKYLSKSAILYNYVKDLFLFNSLHDIETYKQFSGQGLKALLHIDAFRSLHRLNTKSFLTPEMVQLFDRYATYNGSNAYSAPATLKVISHLEHNLGAYFPKNGMYSIVDTLYKSSVAMGVQFYLSQQVQNVRVKTNDKVTVQTGEIKKDYNALVSSVDVRYFYNHLFQQQTIPKRIAKAGFSSSAAIFYWGINKEFPELDIHNILFSEDYKKEFESIYNENKVPDDPTIYIFISSKIVKTDAPQGKENWFVMVNVPANTEIDWGKMLLQIREVIIKKIKRVLGINIEQYIVFEKSGSPQTIYENTSSLQGAIYGNNSNQMLSAFNRQPNFSKVLPNIYFSGGSVHPGGGIPLCIASANIVTNKIIKKHSK